jgi:DNA-binding CsgD family transcriptional regulator
MTLSAKTTSRLSVPVGSLAAMLVSRAGLSPVMVGRDAELTQLRRLASVITAPTIALIGGEPGIGKTRLASELIDAVVPAWSGTGTGGARSAPGGGKPTDMAKATTLLLGQADSAGLAHPYQLLIDLVSAETPTESTVDLSGLVAAVRNSEADPMDRARAARDLLRARVGTGPALLVVDDIHWADPESLAVFEQLDEVTTGPLLLVGTYRPDELSRRHPLAAVLSRLDRRRGVHHLRLERLTPTDTARFLAAVYGRAPARRTATTLHQRTGGNPFFLEELLKAAGDTDLDTIHLQPLPWNLAEALRSQLDGLAPDRRQVVEAAAVLGARAPFDLLAAVTGRDEPELIAALRELVDRGLLMEAEDDQFGFRHALTREAVAGELLGRQRRRLHEAALEALLASPDPDPARLAKHARGAGRYREMLAASKQGARERLAAGAAYAALTLAEAGLEEVPDDTELLELAATAAWRAGYLADARRHATRALRAATDDADRAAALTQLIRVAWEQGELSDMERYTEQVRELAGGLPDGEVQARAMAAVAQSYMLRYHGGPEGPDAAVDWADRAYEVAERHGLKEVRLAALVEKGSALLQYDGTSDEGRRLLTEVSAEAEHAGAHLEAARGWHNLFWCASPDSPPSIEVLERMRISAKRAGVAGMALGSYYYGRSWLAHLDGDLDRAIEVLEEAQRTGRGVTAIDPASGGPIALHMSKGGLVRSQLIQLYLERGDLDAAEALLAELPPSRKWQETATELAFQLACRRGNLTAARELLATLVDAREQSDLSSRHNQLSAGLAAGLPADRLRPLVEQVTSVEKGAALRPLLAAQLAEAQERYEEALTGYERLVDLDGPRRMTVPPAHLGTAAVGAARCLVQLGRLDEARDRLAEAERLLARWSGWRNAELVAVARRLGITGAASDSMLTPREREVAALVADGLTNAEIARRLVISRKTVAVHVSHILAKLEMSSRAQVAAWVARDGLT